MSNKIIGNPESAELSVFDELFALVERHRLSLTEFSLGDFYDILTEFDNSFQKFNTSVDNDAVKDLYNSILNLTFRNFILIFNLKGFNNEPIFFAFKRYISFFSFVIKESNLVNNTNRIHENFFDNFPSLKKDISKLKSDATHYYLYEKGIVTNINQQAIIDFEKNFPIEIGEFENPLKPNLEFKLPIYCNNFIYKEIYWENADHQYYVTEEFYYMVIDIHIESQKTSVEKLIKPLWLLTSTLEQIDNVSLELKTISTGSLYARVILKMKDLLAKEEVKAVLETTKEAVTKTLTLGEVSYTDVKKSIQETKKLSLENDKLQKEIFNIPDENEVQIERTLEIEKKILENEQIKLSNAQAKLNMIKQLSELAASGIVETDMIRIDINDVLYILKDDTGLTEIGPDITTIID